LKDGPADGSTVGAGDGEKHADALGEESVPAGHEDVTLPRGVNSPAGHEAQAAPV